MFFMTIIIPKLYDVTKLQWKQSQTTATNQLSKYYTVEQSNDNFPTSVTLDNPVIVIIIAIITDCNTITIILHLGGRVVVKRDEEEISMQSEIKLTETNV